MRKSLSNRVNTPKKGVRIAAVLLAVILSVLPLTACKADNGWGEDAKGKVKVMTTIFPMYDFVRKIGGEHVAVQMMVPAGTEPHAWEPSSKDMRKIESADVFVYSGNGMEGWVGDLLKGVQNKKLEVVAAGENLVFDRIPDSTDTNPHVWLSPDLAYQEMSAICEALCKADPDHSEAYRANLDTMGDKCSELDNAYQERLSTFENRYIVVAHEAYGYLCDEYGLEQIAIEGVSAESEPDAARMREIIDLVEKYGITCIFFEELVSPKVAETIAEETGCTTQELSPLDGMSQEEIDAGSDYFSVMYANLDAICEALEGENVG